MDANTSDISAIIPASDNAPMRRHRAVPLDEHDDDYSVQIAPGVANWTRWCPTSRCWLLTFLCVAAVGQSMSVNGLIGVTISTIERKFALSSSQTAWITSAYEIAGIPALLVVGYIGSRIRRPVWIAGGLVILSIGIFVYTLPHFVSSLYRYDADSNGTGLVCAVGAVHHDQCQDQDSSSEQSGKEKFMSLFIISSLLMGVGSVPLFVLGVTYIDDFDSNSKSAFDLGLFYSMSVFGPVLAFIGGGYLLNFYVDFNAVAAESVTITDSGPRWVGAWWLGFLISLGLVVLTILPIAFFPADPPGMKVDVKQSQSAENNDETGNEVATARDLQLDLSSGSWREIPKTIWSLITNWTFLFTALYGACDALLIDGFQTFGAKYFQQQFSLTSSMAGIIFGVVAVPGGVGGFLVGSYLIKRYTLPCRVLLPLNFFLTLVCLGLMFSFSIQCDTAPLAGVTDVQYQNRFGSFNTSCNDDCGCSDEWFQPVCGVNDMTYFSACYAGCQQGSQDVGYSSCSCLFANTSSDSQLNSTGWSAVDGVCASSNCQRWRLVLFVILFLLTMFIIFVCGMFHLSIILRVVPHSQRPLSYAVDWMLARLLGATPGPVLFGYILDHSCLLWEHKCSASGACLYYDNHQMGWLMLVGCASCKLLSAVFGFIAWRVYLRQSDQESSGTAEAVLETCRTFSINRSNRVSILDEFSESVLSVASCESDFFEESADNDGINLNSFA